MRLFLLLFLFGLSGWSFGSDLRLYQIGDEWNRVAVKDLSLTFTQEKLYAATGIGGLIGEEDGKKPRLILYSVGSGFLIHTKQGRPAVATALHVFSENAKGYSSEKACREMVWHFPHGEKIYYRGSELLFKSEVLDFALCALDVTEEDQSDLKKRSLEFEDRPLPPQRRLSTIGFGIFKNEIPGRALMDASSDCRNFLPGEKASLRGGIWSLPTGCDASPADSGSAVMDTRSGKVVGVLWGTSALKQTLSSQKLRRISENPLEEETLWSELSLMTPSRKIVEALKQANLL